MIDLAAVVLVAVVAIVAVLVQAERHSNQTSSLLAHAARERWELLTREKAPEVGAHIPAPDALTPQEVLAQLRVLDGDEGEDDEEWADESHLVGTGPPMPGPSEVA